MAKYSVDYDAVKLCKKCPNHAIIVPLFEGVIHVGNTKLKYSRMCNDIYSLTHINLINI